MAFRRDMIPLFIVALVMNLCGNLLGPFLPLYIQGLGASVVQVGLLIALVNLVQVVLRIPGGFIADRFSERGVLLATMLLSAAPPLFYSLSSSWEQLAPWVILSGAPPCLFFPTWNVMIADRAEHRGRARLFATMNMAWPIGSIVGPLAGGVLLQSLGWTVLFYALIVMYVLGTIPSLMFSSRTRRAKRVAFRLDREVLSPLLLFAISQLLVAFSLGVTNPILAIYLTGILGVDKDAVGLFFALCFGVTFLLTQIPGGWLADRFDRKTVIVLSLLTAPLLSALAPMTGAFIPFFVLMGLVMAAFHLTIPATNALFIDILPNAGRGIYSGIVQSVTMLGWTVAPILGSYLYETHGHALPFQVSALFFALTIPAVWLVKFPEESTRIEG